MKIPVERKDIVYKIAEQKCGESCGCKTEKPTKIEEKKAEENDPTRFGDWQVNGRAIDF